MNSILGLVFEVMSKKNFQQAKTILENFLSKDPNNEIALFNLGVCNCKLKEYDTAIQMFEKCVQLDPEHSKAYKSLNCIYRKTGILQKVSKEGEPLGFTDFYIYLDRAIEFLNEINSRIPDTPEVLISLGKVYEKKKDFSSALHCYKKVISENKNQKISNLAKEGIVRIKLREMIENPL